MKRKTMIALTGVVLMIIGLILIYLGNAPIPSLMVVAGYILYALSMMPEKAEKDKEQTNDSKKKKKA